MADTFDRLAEWLQRAALYDIGLDDLVEETCRRLVDGGVPVTRISIGCLLLHPVLAMLDATWDMESGRSSWNTLRRADMDETVHGRGPFGEINPFARQRLKELRHLAGPQLADELTEFASLRQDLTDPDVAAKYPLFQRLADKGTTDYVVFAVPFGNRWFEFDSGMEATTGATVSLTTNRRSGFQDHEIAGFRGILVPFMVAARAATERFFVTELTETYLGRISAQAVLSGQIARGDVRRIDCALLYSDMRESTLVSQQMAPEDYLATVNRYFECVAGAVLDHGGEVLKFMGDGLLAIFPFDNRRRFPEDMCAAALSAAREAFHRRADLPEDAQMVFGVGLHVGEAVYGNVGTEKRLDFTVTGASVALAGRVESMTKTLDAPLLATADFAAMVAPREGRDMGRHALRGFDDEVGIVAFDPLG